MFYGASLLYGASLISPRFSSWLVNELLVSVLEVTPRLYAKIITKRAERKALDRLSHIRHTSTVFTVLIIDTFWCKACSGNTFCRKTHCRVLESSRVVERKKKEACERERH